MGLPGYPCGEKSESGFLSHYHKRSVSATMCTAKLKHLKIQGIFLYVWNCFFFLSFSLNLTNKATDNQKRHN